MKPSILIIYYSQTGQLKQILDSLTHDIIDRCEIEYVEITPSTPFPFPWTNDYFFDCMPECVLELPETIEPLAFKNSNYDLIILGYQPWFLSPSLPTSSFLQSPYASILQGHNVVTVIGARNMWLNAQEKIKSRLLLHKANLVGNIVFKDNHPNLVSLLTVIRWSFKGQKEAGKWLPEAGVSQKDIAGARRFGSILFEKINQTNSLHATLLQSEAIDLKPGLIILEKRGITNFRKFAAFIRAKGERGNPERLSRVKLFNRLLLIGIFILSPISGLTARLAVLFGGKRLTEEVNYFKSIDYRENAI